MVVRIQPLKWGFTLCYKYFQAHSDRSGCNFLVLYLKIKQKDINILLELKWNEKL